jgi:hypothetical protein
MVLLSAPGDLRWSRAGCLVGGHFCPRWRVPPSQYDRDVREPGRYSGGLLAESLSEDAVVDVTLTVTKVFRAAAGDTAAGQPRDWTFIEFSVPTSSVDTLAESLSRALRKVGGWYCDFHSDLEVVVVFYGRIFRYSKGDRTRRAEVEAYARSVGVPEAQLDWPE